MHHALLEQTATVKFIASKSKVAVHVYTVFSLESHYMVERTAMLMQRPFNDLFLFRHSVYKYLRCSGML